MFIMGNFTLSRYSQCMHRRSMVFQFSVAWQADCITRRTEQEINFAGIKALIDVIELYPRQDIGNVLLGVAMRFAGVLADQTQVAAYQLAESPSQFRRLLGLLGHRHIFTMWIFQLVFSVRLCLQVCTHHLRAGHVTLTASTVELRASR